MTAKGKVNASKVQAGDRIIVKVSDRGDSEWVDMVLNDLGADQMVTPSTNKTGDKVYVTTVIGKDKCVNRRGYMIETGRGTFYAEPIQTMWLAPEDAPGIRRALAEAKAEDAERKAAAVDAREDERERVQQEHDWIARHGGVSRQEAELADWDDAIREGQARQIPHVPGVRAMVSVEDQVAELRRDYPGAPAARRIAIRRRLLQLGATLNPGQPDGENDLEIDCLRARFVLEGDEGREKIQARLRELGTVVFPEDTPEYKRFRNRLRTALMDKSAWSGMLEV